MLSCVGMAIGPVVGGSIFDAFHDYRWLYLSSVGIALRRRGHCDLAFPPIARAEARAVAR